MSGLSASVVIVSRDRPAELKKCLKALEFQTCASFELVVVHNETSKRGISDAIAPNIKQISFEPANISAARNLGISHAAGDIIAFIDDDAIAEPTWLSRLLEPFSDRNTAATGGFVRGRNGISYQWTAELLNSLGEATPIEVPQTTAIRGSTDQCLKTQGTNCAFRRDVLVEVDGFDENYHYYLDETDLNIRLGRAGKSVAVVPEAQVQHGFASNATRSANRAPKTLFEIGASSSYFLGKFRQGKEHLRTIRNTQHARLEGFLINGLLEPHDISKLMATLEAGFKEGENRELQATRIPHQPNDFLPFQETEPLPSHRFLTGPWLHRADLHRSAKASADQKIPTTLLLLSFTSWRHKRYFHANGYWVQTGGLFGKSDRFDPVFRLYRYRKRYRREIRDMQKTRP